MQNKVYSVQKCEIHNAKDEYRIDDMEYDFISPGHWGIKLCAC